ncbi:hypothetical protein AMJ85_07380 [candidate division BRC1 bacterium SM23_51]|nr:MAG: hypothetical protein AMJ85_07380 [candidate division BRC1 bacterium SM23_51]
MHKIMPPICLFLALTCVICGFVLLAMGEPEVDMALHRARIDGEEQYRQRLEERLEHRQLSHKLWIGGCFASAVLFTGAAFATMSPSRRTG